MLFTMVMLACLMILVTSWHNVVVNVVSVVCVFLNLMVIDRVSLTFLSCFSTPIALVHGWRTVSLYY